MKIEKKSILKYLIEILIVAFGVFLGIAVSEHKADKKTKKNVAESLELIIDELSSNSIMLDKSIKYHELIEIGFDSMDIDLSKETANQTYFSNKVFRHNDIPNWQGLGISEVEDIAFESAKIGGIFQALEIEKIKLISKAYRMLSSNLEFRENVGNRLIGMNSDTKVIDVIAVIEILTNDVLNSEKYIKTEIDNIIEELKK